MNTRIIKLIISTLVALSFSACGSSGGSTPVVTDDTNDTNTSFVVERTLSLGESSSFIFDTSLYFDDVDSFSVIESKSLDSRDLTHTSDDLNVTIIDGVLVVTAGSVDETTVYNFTVTGTEITRALTDINIAVEVVESSDDQPIGIISILWENKIKEISFTLSDSDTMISASLIIKDEDNNTVVDSPYSADSDNATLISVTDSFDDLIAGKYTAYITATGVVGGDGDRSTLSVEYIIEVPEEVVDIVGQFNFTNMSNQNLSTFVTTNTEVITGNGDVTTTRGTFILNGTDTNLDLVSVEDGDTLAVRVQTSGSYSTSISTTVTSGGVSDTFTVSTKSAPALTPEEQCVASGGIWVDGVCVS